MNYPISFYPIWREDKRWQPMELSDMDVTPLSNTFYRFFKYLNYILSYHSIPVHFALLYCILLIQTCLIRASDNWNQTTKDILRISQKTSSTQNRLSIKVNHNQNMTQTKYIFDCSSTLHSNTRMIQSLNNLMPKLQATSMLACNNII